MLPRKISFHGTIKRDVLLAKKVVLCYRCKTRDKLGENCPEASPTTEDSSMSLIEQSNTPKEDQAPVQPESSAEALLPAESQQTSSPTQEEVGKGDSSSTGGVALVLIQVQVQSQAMTMSLFWNLLLDRKSPRRGPLTCLLERICLLFRDLGLIPSRIIGGQNLIYP